jgi:putative transposase
MMITDHVPAVGFPPDNAASRRARLARREETWKTAEILILRHQLAVLQRRPRRPKLNWADRALLTALLSVIPKSGAAGPPGPCGARPAARRTIKALVLRLARENTEWGYRRIHGELAGLGVKVAASTVGEILQANGIDPAPRRTGPAWPQVLRSQADAILASDFFTAGLPGGTQAYVLAVIEHATRRIRILGVTPHPTGEWTAQQARNFLMDLGGQADRIKFMIRDRGPDFTAALDACSHCSFADFGVRTAHLAGLEVRYAGLSCVRRGGRQRRFRRA